jgi:hypothetical protein
VAGWSTPRRHRRRRRAWRIGAAWIAELLAHGLIRSSFVPPAPIQDLRDLTRTRKQLVREACQHTLRIQKTLEDANIKPGSPRPAAQLLWRQFHAAGSAQPVHDYPETHLGPRPCGAAEER